MDRKEFEEWADSERVKKWVPLSRLKPEWTTFCFDCGAEVKLTHTNGQLCGNYDQLGYCDKCQHVLVEHSCGHDGSHGVYRIDCMGDLEYMVFKPQNWEDVPLAPGDKVDLYYEVVADEDGRFDELGKEPYARFYRDDKYRQHDLRLKEGRWTWMRQEETTGQEP